MRAKLHRVLKKLASGTPLAHLVPDFVGLNFKLNAIERQNAAIRSLLEELQHTSAPDAVRTLAGKALHHSKTIQFELDQRLQRGESDPLDPLIAPLCRHLTECGYTTVASCSAHVGSYRSSPGSDPFYKKQWYVLFWPTRSITPLRRVCETLRADYGYPVEITRFSKESHQPLVLYRMQMDVRSYLPRYTDEDLYRINETIYRECKKEVGVHKKPPHQT